MRTLKAWAWNMCMKADSIFDFQSYVLFIIQEELREQSRRRDTPLSLKVWIGETLGFAVKQICWC